MRYSLQQSQWCCRISLSYAALKEKHKGRGRYGRSKEIGIAFPLITILGFVLNFVLNSKTIENQDCSVTRLDTARLCRACCTVTLSNRQCLASSLRVDFPANGENVRAADKRGPEVARRKL